MVDVVPRFERAFKKPIQELSRKYWQANNPSVKQQIAIFIDLYKTELSMRRARQWEQTYQKRDKDLDNLIKVS